jgi:hypothetical protein
VIEARVYRAAFIPALLALVLAMFSFQSQPSPLRQGLAADILFDGNEAALLAERIATEQPDRRAGRPGDAATADLVAREFARSGFQPDQIERQRFTHAGERLENVIARRAGGSRRQIVIVAARDAGAVPDGPGSASDTAALLELSRVFQGRPSRKTLVLASVDGSTLGEVGTERLVSELGSTGFVDAVLVMSSLGSNASEPSVQSWSNDARRASIGLQRTVADSIRQELDRAGGEGTGVLGQLARLAFPIGIGPQGPLLAEGYEAVRISGSGELPPPGDGPVEDIDEDRLGALGRATLRTVTALDQGRRPEHGPESYVLAVSQVLPGWVISLFAGAMLLPVLVASVDAFARARRRHQDVLPWLRFMGAWVAPFLAGLALAELLAATGATPPPPPAPVAPSEWPLDGPALAVLGGVLVGMALALVLGRWLAARPDARLKRPDEPGAAVAVALTISLGSFALWVLNPWAGLLAVPAAHLWMLAVLVRPPPSRRARLLMVAGGLVAPLLVTIYYLFALSLDPLHGAWYLLGLVTGHSVGIATSLAGCLMLAAVCATVEITWRVPGEEEPAPGQTGPSVFGPGAYAGPGSLGGTRSALRR